MRYGGLIVDGTCFDLSLGHLAETGHNHANSIAVTRFYEVGMLPRRCDMFRLVVGLPCRDRTGPC